MLDHTTPTRLHFVILEWTQNALSQNCFCLMAVQVDCSVHLVMVYTDILQDYHWWWHSFVVSGGSAVYVFAYAVFYFITKVCLFLVFVEQGSSVIQPGFIRIPECSLIDGSILENIIDGSTARRCIAIVTNERRASYVIPLNSS